MVKQNFFNRNRQVGSINSVTQNDLANLGADLQQELRQQWVSPPPLQIRCAARDEGLVVLAEHLLHIEPQPRETFIKLEQEVRQIVPKLLQLSRQFTTSQLPSELRVQLFLRIAGYQQPYASHQFQLDLRRSAAPASAPAPMRREQLAAEFMPVPIEPAKPAIVEPLISAPAPAEPIAPSQPVPSQAFIEPIAPEVAPEVEAEPVSEQIDPLVTDAAAEVSDLTVEVPEADRTPDADPPELEASDLLPTIAPLIASESPAIEVPESVEATVEPVPVAPIVEPEPIVEAEPAPEAVADEIDLAPAALETTPDPSVVEVTPDLEIAADAIAVESELELQTPIETIEEPIEPIEPPSFSEAELISEPEPAIEPESIAATPELLVETSAIEAEPAIEPDSVATPSEPLTFEDLFSDEPVAESLPADEAVESGSEQAELAIEAHEPAAELQEPPAIEPVPWIEPIAEETDVEPIRAEPEATEVQPPESFVTSEWVESVVDEPTEVEPIEPVAIESIEPATIDEPVEPIEQTAPVEFIEPPVIESVEPTVIDEPIEAIESVEPTVVDEPIESVELTAPVGFVEPAVVDEPVESIETVELPAVELVESPVIETVAPTIDEPIAAIAPEAIEATEPPVVDEPVETVEPAAIDSIEIETVELPTNDFVESIESSVESIEAPPIEPIEPPAVGFVEPTVVESIDSTAVDEPVETVEPAAIESIETVELPPVEFVEPTVVESIESTVVDDIAEPIESSVETVEPAVIESVEPTVDEPIETVEPAVIESVEPTVIDESIDPIEPTLIEPVAEAQAIAEIGTREEVASPSPAIEPPFLPETMPDPWGEDRAALSQDIAEHDEADAVDSQLDSEELLTESSLPEDSVEIDNLETLDDLPEEQTIWAESSGLPDDSTEIDSVDTIDSLSEPPASTGRTDAITILDEEDIPAAQHGQPVAAMPGSVSQAELSQESNVPGIAQPVPAETKTRRPFRWSASNITLVTAIGGFIAVGGGYLLTRPCVIGDCEPLQVAQQLGQEAIQTARTTDSSLEVIDAYKKLNEANYLLGTIPSWSPYRREAESLLKNYEGQVVALGKVVGALEKADQASKKSQNPPHPVQEWREIQWLWRESITQLQAIPPNDPLYELVQRKLEEYQKNLSGINQRVAIEQQAQDRITAARQIEQLGTARASAAKSPANWQETASTWMTAIEQLRQIPQGTMAYNEAQQLLAIYQPKLAEANLKRNQEQTAVDVYAQALDSAKQAQLMEQQNQWIQAATYWQDALTYVQQVPSGSTYFNQVQTLADSYRQSLQRSQQNSQRSIAVQAVKPSLEEACSGSPRLCTYTLSPETIRVQFTGLYDKTVETLITKTEPATGANSIPPAIVDQVNSLLRSLADVGEATQVPIELYDSRGTKLGIYTPSLSGYVAQ